MALRIPKEDIPALVAIRELPRVSVDELLTSLSSAPHLSDSDEMAEAVAPGVSSIGPDKLKLIFDTLYTLYYIREFAGVRPEKFLADILDEINTGEYPELTDNLTELISNLKSLLSDEKLTVIAKARRLQRDGERLYCNSKVLSDIRPVFAEDPSRLPCGAVVTHTLRISYHEGDEYKDFHIILDSDDVEGLQAVLERAHKKDRTLRNLLKKADVSELGR